MTRTAPPIPTPAPPGVPSARPAPGEAQDADGTTGNTKPGDAKPAAAERRRLHHILYRKLLFALGILFLMVGIIGMAVPMLPGTIFLIFAAWCFTRSSPRFEAWLLNHRYLGPSVVRWRETGAVPPVAKAFALASFVGTFSGSWYFGAPQAMLIGLGVMFAALAVFILTRPNG